MLCAVNHAQPSFERFALWLEGRILRTGGACLGRVGQVRRDSVVGPDWYRIPWRTYDPPQSINPLPQER